MTPKLRHVVLAAFLLAFVTTGMSPGDVQAQTEKEGYLPIFNGRNLEGWHISAESGHSRASEHTSGGEWFVRNGAIIGSQDTPGNGGLIVTDETYGDFEVVLEMKNDYGPDSGLFLRSTEDGKAYQAMIDYHADGNLMGIYGEGMGGQPHVRSFNFKSAPSEIAPVEDALVKLPVASESWSYFWRHGEWNELRARIVGNPPTITTWINGVKIMEWTGTEEKLPDTGKIALQVHGGGDYTDQHVRYRNVRVKRLDD